MKIPPPRDEQELLDRASAIAGISLGQLASRVGAFSPYDQLHDKGWAGQLLETALGANAASKPEPDFSDLAIELKTLPLNKRGKPKESTFVCTIALLGVQDSIWEDSLVCRKLSRVLWIPIEAESAIPLAQRRIGSAILWSPSPEQERILRQDWQELIDLIVMGRLSEINGKRGQYLQVRPKAANARSLCWGVGETGARVLTLPRGFYLRTRLTVQLLST